MKRGRRYRYYLGRQGDKMDPAKRPRVCVPAHALEQLVKTDFVQLFRQPDLDELLDCSDAGVGQEVRQQALALADRWPTMTEPEQRRWWHAVELEVVVGPEQIGWSVDPGRLAAGLKAGSPEGVVPAKASEQSPRHRRHRCERLVQAKLIRCGGETRIVTEEGSPPCNPQSRTSRSSRRSPGGGSITKR